MRTIYTFDTTLRDGEQSPGVNLNDEEKVEIALQLERLGVDVIEAGFAASSPGDLRAVQAVARAVKNATVVSLARANPADIDAAREALKDAANPRLHVFLATSPIHRQYKLRMTKEQVLEQIAYCLDYAKKYFSEIEFSAEDGSRTELDFLTQVVDVAIRHGATVINIPDTVGYATPEEYGNIFRHLKNTVPGIEKVQLSCHCHDDLGMAVANTLAAIEAGADQVEGCINGIGERAGNVALEEVVMALETRKDYYKAQSTWVLKEIYRTSRLVSRLTGMIIQKNKAIVGDNAFSHESGIHQDGVLKEKTTYEIIRPETVGAGETKLPLGKLSGRHAFKKKLEQLGYQLNDEQINQFFRKFKELADRKKTVTDEDIMAIVDERISQAPVMYTLDYFHLSYGTQATPAATIRLRTADGDVIEEAAFGNGSVDAIYKAIDKATENTGELVDFRISSVTKGKDALGEVTVKMQMGDWIIQGRGVSTDILEASARAYLDAINRYYQRKSALGEPQPSAAM